MTDKQIWRVNAALKFHSPVTQAQIVNLIESVLDGKRASAQVKACDAWQRLTDAEKVEVSALLNKWEYEAAGHKGSDTQAALQAYYGSTCTTSPIMPSRLVV